MRTARSVPPSGTPHGAIDRARDRLARSQRQPSPPKFRQNRFARRRRHCRLWIRAVLPVHPGLSARPWLKIRTELRVHLGAATVARNQITLGDKLLVRGHHYTAGNAESSCEFTRRWHGLAAHPQAAPAEASRAHGQSAPETPGWRVAGLAYCCGSPSVSSSGR